MAFLASSVDSLGEQNTGKQAEYLYLTTMTKWSLGQLRKPVTKETWNQVKGQLFCNIFRKPGFKFGS